MKSYFLIGLFSFLFCFNVQLKCERKQNKYSSKSFAQVINLQDLYNNPKFKKWLNFWKSNVPELSDFQIEKKIHKKKISPTKTKLKNWLETKYFRKFTLNFSPEKNAVADLYAHVDFKYKNDTIYVNGGSIDPYFEILNMQDSLLYHFTLGPESFFDESIWLSDSVCYILGFTISPNMNKEKAHSNLIILRWNNNSKRITIYLSRNYPFKNRIMNFSTYMRYLYPSFRYTF